LTTTLNLHCTPHGDDDDDDDDGQAAEPKPAVAGHKPMMEFVSLFVAEFAAVLSQVNPPCRVRRGRATRKWAN
jgi:hypothetical protein